MPDGGSGQGETLKAKGLLDGLRDGAVKHIGATLGGFALTAAIAGAVTSWAMIKSWVITEIPTGLVVASSVECRDLQGGWANFDAAAGRFIIGAGAHPNNPGVTKSYDVFKIEGENPRSGLEKSTGGEEQHLILPSEIPQLAGNWRSDLGAGDQSAATKVFYNDDKNKYSSMKIIPPYVALFYCKKI